MTITKYFSLKILIFAPKFMFHLKYIKIMTTNEMILQTQLIWFSRYLNYKYERDILASSDFGLTDSGQQPEFLLADVTTCRF